MRLAFDLDGTVADMQDALAREARVLFPDLNPETLPRSISDNEPGTEPRPEGSTVTPLAPLPHTLSARQLREVWQTVRTRVNFWETLAEIEPGALARLYETTRSRQWEVIFLTSRPETAGATAQMQSYRWLQMQGYQTPSVFVVHGSRGKIASALALDAVVDDRPENCLDVAIDSTARPILVWRGAEDTVPGSARQLGIGAVPSIAQCLDILESIDRDTTDRDGVVDRLKRLLGLRPRAGRPREPVSRNVVSA